MSKAAPKPQLKVYKPDPRWTPPKHFALTPEGPTTPTGWNIEIDIGLDRTQWVEHYYIRRDEELPHLVAWLQQQKVVGVDVETSAEGAKPHFLKNRLATLQIGNPKAKHPRAYVIDVRAVSKAALAPVLALLASRKLRKLGQNIKFECVFIRHNLGVLLRNVACTQVAEQVARCGLFDAMEEVAEQQRGRKGGFDGEEGKGAYKWTSMDKLCRRYLNLTIDKSPGVRLSFDLVPPGTHDLHQVVYAAGDVIYPFYIADEQKPVLEARALINVARIEFDFIPVAADAEVTGIAMDLPAWRALWQEAVTNLSIARRELDKLLCSVQGDLFGGTDATVRPLYEPNAGGKKETMNWDSPYQITWAIRRYCEGIGWGKQLITSYDELNKIKAQDEDAKNYLEWLRKRDPKATMRDVPDHVLSEQLYCILLKADKDTLQLRKIRGQLPANLVDQLLAYGKWSIRDGTFGKEFLNKHIYPDGRLHTEIHICATNTGRVSTAPNTQNIPSDPRYRKCFVPKPGWKFCIADYSQIEPRLSAQVSGDPNYVATFTSKDDIYLRVQEAMLGERLDPNTPEGEKMRAIFKVVVLSLAYRMGARKLRDRLTLALKEDVTFEYAKDLHTRFLQVHADIKLYQELCETLADHKLTTRPKIWDDMLQDVVTWSEGPCGRKRFFAPTARSVYTEAPNAPIQGSSATITKAAAVLIDYACEERGWTELAHLVNAVHDELVYEVHDSIAVEFAQLMKEKMEEAGRVWVPTVPIIAEFPKNTNGTLDFWAKKVEEFKEAKAA